MDPNFFNLSKRKKSNLLSDLLQGKSTEGIISKKELNALNRLIDDTHAVKAPAKVFKKRAQTKKVTVAANTTKKTKIKSTHYLSREVSENLDKAQMTIRSLVPENLRSKVSKSQIVNQALAIILQEFEAKGKNSTLVRIIKQKT